MYDVLAQEAGSKVNGTPTRWGVVGTTHILHTCSLYLNDAACLHGGCGGEECLLRGLRVVCCGEVWRHTSGWE